LNAAIDETWIAALDETLNVAIDRRVRRNIERGDLCPCPLPVGAERRNIDRRDRLSTIAALVDKNDRCPLA